MSLLSIVQSGGGSGGGGGSTPGGSDGQLQVNGHSTFVGMPGTVVDYTNGTLSIAPPDGGSATSPAFEVTGDDQENDILDLYNNTGTNVVSVNYNGSLTANIEIPNNILLGSGSNITIGAAGLATLTDALGSTGTSSQVLSSTITGVKWITLPLAVTEAKVSHNWLDSYTATTGAFTQSQPAAADLSDSASSAGNVLRANGTSFVSAQLGYGDLSGLPTLYTNPMTTLGDILYENASPAPARLAGNTTSTRNFLRSLGASSTATAPVWDTLQAGDIPNLAASIITSGVLALARGGNTFSALGDLIYSGVAAAPTVLSGNTTTTKMYLSQTGAVGPVSAAPAWAQINYADLTGTTPTPPSGAVLWSALGNAGTALTLANAGYATTFNQTSAVNWTWANTTAATAAGAVSNSPVYNLAGTYFTLGASAADTWSLSTSISAPKTSATVGNTSETSGSVVTMAVTAGTGTFAPNDVVTFTSLPTFTWLNGQNVTLNSNTTSTSLQFTDPTTHGTQASHNESGGQVTQTNPASTLNIGQSGSGGAFVTSPTVGVGSSVNINATAASSATNGGPSLSLSGTKCGIGAYVSGASKYLQLFSSSQSFYFSQPGNASNCILTVGNGGGTNGLCASFYAPGGATMLLSSSLTTGVGTAGIATAIGNLGAFTGVTAGSQVGVQLVGPWSNSGNGNNGSFAPAYGPTTFMGVNINPTINQAALTNTIVGTEVISTTAAVVFTATNTWTNSYTTDTVAAVTNTGINGVQNITPTTTVSRTSVTVTNSSETAGNVVTLTVGTHAIVANDYCYLSGLTTATWLNGKAVKITSVVANTSITFTDPTSHGTSTSQADTGTVVTSYIKYTTSAGAVSLTQDTGIATQQAAGAYTALNIAVTETAVQTVNTNYLIKCLAGAAGTTPEFAITNAGICSTYGGTATVSQGIPSEIITVDLTAQTAAISATTLISAPATGMYRISWVADITTISDGTSVLGGTNGFQAIYTSPTDTVVKTTVVGDSITSAANTTGTTTSGSLMVYAKATTNIQYSFDYTSVQTTTKMAFELHVKLERL